MKLSLLALSVTLLVAVPLFAGHGGSGSHGSAASMTGAKTVAVQGYVKKDGTVVRGYVRSAPPQGSVTTTTTNGGHVESRTTTAPVAATRSVATVGVVKVRVLGDPTTKRYYRASCSAPASAVAMTRTAAIAAGYRPDPACFSKPAQ